MPTATLAAKEAGLIALIDRMATARQNARAVAPLATGTTGWQNIWAIDDTEWCDALVANNVPANVDTALATGSAIDAALQPLWNQITNVLAGFGYTAPYYLDSFLAVASGRRVPYDAAASMSAAGINLPAYRVFPKGVWAANIGANATAGLHEFAELTEGASTWTLAVVSGTLPATVIGSAVIAVSNVGVTGNSTFTLTLTTQAGTTRTITLTSQAFAANTQVVVGKVDVTGAISSVGATSITASGVLATGAFAVNEYAMIWESDAKHEIFQIGDTGAITTNAIALAAGTTLKQTYTTGADLWPLFTNVTAVGTASGGTTGEKIQLYARPDRAIAL